MLYGPDGVPVATENELHASVAATVNQEMRQFLIDCLHDQQQHAFAVADGPYEFRRVINKCLGPLYGNTRGQVDHLADVMYKFLKASWRERYPHYTARAWLDGVHIASPISAAEKERIIEESWELDIASSEEAMRQHYEGSVRKRKGSWLGSIGNRIRNLVTGRR